MKRPTGLRLETSFVQILNDPDGETEASLRKAAQAKGAFHLLLAGTRTSDLPGISAAGITPEMRRLTPATDAEALVLGHTVSVDSIPLSPTGIASPVVITRACLQLLEMAAQVIDCGTFVKAACPAEIVGNGPAQCLSSGAAMSVDHVHELFALGIKYGAERAKDEPYLVIAECVPGGTTTALGLLTALRIEAKGLLSSSLPQCNQSDRSALVEAGLEKAKLASHAVKKDPLLAVAAVGDPMQAFAAGMALAAAATRPVFLAGGSQMLAVHALLQAITGARALPRLKHNPVVVTTKWVALDSGADTQRLSRLTAAPYVASCPDFRQSRHDGLKAYEEGNVKEGIGAGAAMLLAHLTAGKSAAEIMDAIDHVYEELCLR